MLGERPCENLQTDRETVRIGTGPDYHRRPARQIIGRCLGVISEFLGLLVADSGFRIHGANKQVVLKEVTQHAALVVVPEMDELGEFRGAEGFSGAIDDIGDWR